MSSAISTMLPHESTLTTGSLLLIREVTVEDAPAVLDYVHAVSAESDFLSFGAGEFDFSVADEREFIRKCRAADNQLFMMGLIDDTIVSILNFLAGRRPRIRHCGELSLTVRKQYWGQGIGSLMLDTLIDWAKQTTIIKKLNLRVRTDHHRAIALYERKGFVREGTISREILLNGKFYDHHWMGLEL